MFTIINTVIKALPATVVAAMWTCPNPVCGAVNSTDAHGDTCRFCGTPR